ncbi:hypothetical protein [Actinokineospora enzanensis]|uniref:hypothetical protein n=1 Tax=Actinokineospora enzanensis TaxID=155975 RepID=UPI00035F6BBA|nr:hypothetical protein [Actinokineospora enzanensis]
MISGDPLWWGVWWPWALLWLVTFGCVLVAGTVLLVEYTGRPRYRHRPVRVGYFLDRAPLGDLPTGPEDTPAEEITDILAALDAADELVHVDLRALELGVGRPGSRALGDRFGRDPRRRRLRDLDGFVVLKGSFRAVAQNADTVTLAAPFGDPPDPAQAPRVQVTCRLADLRTRLPEGVFAAYCLARPLDWKRRDRRLVLAPVALFQ